MPEDCNITIDNQTELIPNDWPNILHLYLDKLEQLNPLEREVFPLLIKLEMTTPFMLVRHDE